MRHWIWASLAGAALAALTACSKPTPAAGGGQQAAASAAPASAPSGPLSLDQLPHRKPGLWRQAMTMEGVDRAMPTSELCLDAASEAKMSLIGQQARNNHCAPPQFSRGLDGSFSFTTHCDNGPGGQTDTTGTITGDFNSSYKMDMDMKTAGAASPAANGERKMTLTTTWLGPCAPGQKGGDVIMANGMKINMVDAQGGQ